MPLQVAKVVDERLITGFSTAGRIRFGRVLWWRGCVSYRIEYRAAEGPLGLGQVNRSKIRPELTFPLTHTMPL
jgi:hypothetical protein